MPPGIRMARVRKRFGQHFLTDAAVIERIFDALGVGAADRVLEIGPGTGALTRGLQARAGGVVAVEIDRHLAAALERRLPAVEVVRGDALEVDLAALLGDAEGGRRRIVGNLPYNISTPLLGRLFAIVDQVADMHFMLQAEVAARLAAPPATKVYGRLSVIAQYYCRIERLFEVDAASFTPPPKVDSAFVGLTARHRESCDVDALGRILRMGFAQRRKVLANALKPLPVDWPALGIDPGARAENLSVQDWVAIANHHGHHLASQDA